jgi:hypothetical protein
MPRVNMDEEDGPDDSDITPAEVVADIVGKAPQRRIVRQADGGGLSSAADIGETQDDVPEVAGSVVEVPEEKGRGKRKKKENQLYAGWWRHEAEDGRDMPGEPGMIEMATEEKNLKRVQRKQNGSKFTQVRT